MGPIPLNAVRATAADIAADTFGTAVAAPDADIAGAAADIAADARAAALADAAADTAVVAADAAADATVVAADVASAAVVAFTSPAPPAASGFEASGQGMPAVGPVLAPVELLHANETTLQLG